MNEWDIGLNFCIFIFWQYLYWCFSVKVCREGYHLNSGDIAGWGQIRGNIDTDGHGCANLCHEEQEFCWYEHCLTENLCNLNPDCNPKYGKYKDLKFVLKVYIILNILIY